MMKKLFLLFLIFPLCVACSDNDDDNSVLPIENSTKTSLVFQQKTTSFIDSIIIAKYNKNKEYEKIAYLGYLYYHNLSDTIYIDDDNTSDIYVFFNTQNEYGKWITCKSDTVFVIEKNRHNTLVFTSKEGTIIDKRTIYNYPH